MGTVRIAIVDDHDLFREGIRLVLEQIEGFEVVLDTADGHVLIDSVQSIMPDVVLMDVNMPTIDGVETTRRVLETMSNLKVIALTMFSDVSHYTQMINSGVKGFVLKNANKHELQQAISEVFNGGNYFSQEILQKVAFQTVEARGHNPNRLSDRELCVLQLVCKGLRTQEISEKLFISAKTVEVHRSNIFLKAEVRNTPELIIWAIKNNLFTIE